MRVDNRVRGAAIVFLFCASLAQAMGQAATPAPAEPKKTKASTTQSASVIMENSPVAPQVVTILHRLNGLKIFRLLLRSGEQIGAIANLDETFQMTGEVHTNVIAGLALDDGQTIAAWLPEAEAELALPPTPFAPKRPTPPPGTTQVRTPSSFPGLPPVSILGLTPAPIAGRLLDIVDLRVITREGKLLPAGYIGLDGVTGLSVIRLANNNLPRVSDAKQEDISVGQRLRLFAPEPAPRPESGTRTTVYVRIGETEATVVNVSRASSGGLARVKIKSAKISPANIGGIAINDAGETLGIVDRVEDNEATIVPVSAVRNAARRVMARQASVPRPWLGVQGEPIGALSLDQILRGGWQIERARVLSQKRQGILLTSVAPGSPAALAALRPGDVILRVNNDEVRNADEFSWLLEEVGTGSPVNFTVARPGTAAFKEFEIKLSESPDPFFGLRKFPSFGPEAIEPGSLLSQGLETIALKPRVASRFGASVGLLVVSVQPSAAAFKAGLRPGDVIEAINGNPVVASADNKGLLKLPSGSSTFNVVRNKQKFVFTVVTSPR